MPANEQTWRSPQVLHIVFGVSSLAMLVATLAMLAADHKREWKGTQREFRKIETASAQFQIQDQQTDQFKTELKAKQDALAATRQQTPSEKLVDQFTLEILYYQALQADQLSSAQESEYQSIQRGENGDNQQRLVDELERLSQKNADVVEIRERYKAAGEAQPDDRPAARDALFNAMRDVIGRIRFREDNLAGETKTARANLDKARADYELAVGADRPVQELKNLQAVFDRYEKNVERLTKDLQAANTNRKELEATLKEITADEDVARKEVDKLKTEQEQLEKSLYAKAPNFAKRLVEMPVLDAFGSPLQIKQIWLPTLTRNNNFRDVARFDRCTTCHLGIASPAPGSAVDPNYHQVHPLTITLPVPAKPVLQKNDKDEEIEVRTPEAFYGLQIADKGVLNEYDATVSVVRANSPAAIAGLFAGDVIERINDVKILNPEKAVQYLVDEVNYGQAPLTLKIRRGVPQPYSTHPRLDLFVGSLSPHPMEKFGCTICHQGQGSGTAFQWASHTPNSPDQAEDWARNRGWFHNHHWETPMLPQRFEEANCLKCHHQVVELESSPRFPDPPAPKLTEGHNIIRNFGCFGCHEINGFDGPTRRVGPDMRVEPTFGGAAAQIAADPGWSKMPAEARGWAEQLVAHPENDTVRRRLREFLMTDAAAKKDLSPATLKVESALKDIEAPGNLRKVGPSLRHLASKVDFAFTYDWIRNPQNFRPSTKMPRFFGLWDHLDGKGLEEAEQFEPIEIRAATEYLLKSSQKFEYVEKYPEVKAEASVERGKTAFQMRGCLACHHHEEFPGATSTQGPDLSNIGAKLDHHPDGPKGGAKWLYSWVRDPQKYHPRSLMPNVLLQPVEDKSGLTDPAADITAYLMQSKGAEHKEGGAGFHFAGPWSPQDIPDPAKLSKAEAGSLNELALLHLMDKFPERLAREYLKAGIPEKRRADIKGDEVALIGGKPSAEEQQERLVQYVGRRTISKYGCYGCHDIPGYEDAKPIGTALADWGRKDPSRLAFEQINRYLEGHGGHGHGGHGKQNGKAHAKDAKAGHASHAASAANGKDSKNGKSVEQARRDHEFFHHKVTHHEREGFLWQKLREPRSYDYKKTENKKYNERLRMPQFNFTEEQVEAVMTFVLGLTAEPPALQFQFRPDKRQAAIVEGRRLLEKYNCGGCHTLRMDRWDIEYKTDDYKAPQSTDFAFLNPHFPADLLEASVKKVDRRGLKRATLIGMAEVNEKGESVIAKQETDDGDEIEGRRVTLFEPAVIDGQVFKTGATVLMRTNRPSKHYPAEGGDLARLLYPTAVAAEIATIKTAPSDAWGWLPPPLIREGAKVQSDWLHSFLLDPHVIRPATVLRMPKFNMTSAEAAALVDYFAAVDGVDYPYQADARTGLTHLQQADQQYAQRLQTANASPERTYLEDALRIVTDNTYCVKCHKVGDFTPPGSPRTHAPNLERIHQRMRPDYLLPWLANPKRLLPYTGMPQNIPPDKPVDQKLFVGDSAQQLDGLVDLLMNYDRFIKGNYSIKQRYIKEPPPVDPAAKPADDAPKKPPTAEE